MLKDLSEIRKFIEEEIADGDNDSHRQSFSDEQNDTVRKFMNLITQEKKGEPGEPGKDGPEGPEGPEGKPGKDGRDGKDGVDGKDGADGIDGNDGEDGINGKDGKDGRDGVNGRDGQDGSPDTPKDIVKKLESLKGDKRLDASAIKNLPIQDIPLSGMFGKAVKSFKALSDTPNTYVGQANKVVSVKSDETGLEFTAPGGVGSGITRTVVVTSGNFTAGSTASVDYVYLISGAHAVSLPAATGNSNRYTFKNNHSAAVTISRAGADVINYNSNGLTSITINPLDSVDLISNNTDTWSSI